MFVGRCLGFATRTSRAARQLLVLEWLRCAARMQAEGKKQPRQLHGPPAFLHRPTPYTRLHTVSACLRPASAHRVRLTDMRSLLLLAALLGVAGHGKESIGAANAVLRVWEVGRAAQAAGASFPSRTHAARQSHVAALAVPCNYKLSKGDTLFDVSVSKACATCPPPPAPPLAATRGLGLGLAPAGHSRPEWPETCAAAPRPHGAALCLPTRSTGP